MNSDEHQNQDRQPEQEPPVEAPQNLEEPLAPVEPVAKLDINQTTDIETTDATVEPTAIEPAAEQDENAVAELEQVVAEIQHQEQASKQEAELEQRVAELQRQEQALRQEIATLQAAQTKMLQEQLTQTQTAMGRLVQEALSDMEQRKQALQIAVEQLERRRERIRDEMKRSFAGTSQELAIRVQGFKDYLVGSLQDLAASAEQLDLVKVPEPQQKPVVEEPQTPTKQQIQPKFAEQGFQSTAKQIRGLLDQYRSRPDYYGPPWQLRRTFEPVHAERVSNWFFTQGGRGALRTMGSRLQNILISSAVISVLSTLYGDRVRALILANSPERLGEWRRGLQDCLGISRSEFGPDRGVVLFESAEALVLKADRLVTEGDLPLIIIDETEDKISLSLLQFPMWLAFAPDPQQMAAAERFNSSNW